MDELTLLRDLDGDAPGLSPRARLAARTRLQREIGRPPSRPRRPSWNGQTAAALLLVVTVVGALVVVVRDIAAGDQVPGYLRLVDPDPDVLQLAARETDGLAPPLRPRPGQYLYTRSITEVTPIGPGGNAKTFEEEGWGLMGDGQGREKGCEIGVCRTTLRTSSWAPYGEDLDKIPRDPRRLLLYARAWKWDDAPRPSAQFSADDWWAVYDFMFTLLERPLVVPADLRSALIRALAYTPHVKILDDQLDFNGRPAAVLDRSAPGPYPSMDRYLPDPIIDRYTYEPLGFRSELGPVDMTGRNRMFNASRARVVSRLAEAKLVDRFGQRP